MTKETGFFPEHLNFSVKDQKELDKVLANYANLSNAYVWTAVTHKDIKAFYEANWPKVKAYLDKDFLEIFKTDNSSYVARAWEFYLASVFLEYSIPLKKKNGKKDLISVLT